MLTALRLESADSRPFETQPQWRFQAFRHSDMAAPMNAPSLACPQPVKLTVDDFMLLDEAGAFIGYSKTELIDGTIVSMSPQHAQHFTVKSLLYRRVADACDALGRGLEAWVEGSVSMPPHSMPEPDIIVTRERPVQGPVRLETAVLLIEIAATTVAFDLGKKAEIYAANGVPEYWVVDVPARVVHQFWTPRDGRYAQARTTALGARVAAVTIEGLAVETDGL